MRQRFIKCVRPLYACILINLFAFILLPRDKYRNQPFPKSGYPLIQIKILDAF
jgi:hypothetical protein